MFYIFKMIIVLSTLIYITSSIHSNSIYSHFTHKEMVDKSLRVSKWHKSWSRWPATIEHHLGYWTFLCTLTPILNDGSFKPCCIFCCNSSFTGNFEIKRHWPNYVARYIVWPYEPEQCWFVCCTIWWVSVGVHSKDRYEYKEPPKGLLIKISSSFLI